MKFEHAGGRVLLTGIALALACPSYAVERSSFSHSIEVSSRVEAGAKILHINHPGDDAFLGNQGQAADFDAERVERRTVKIGQGQTIADILHASGISRGEASAAARALGTYANLRRLQIGQEVTLYLSPLPRPVIGSILIGVALDIGKGKSALAFRDFNGKFTPRRIDHEDAIALLESIVVVDKAEDTADSGSLVNRDFVLRRSQSIYRLLVESGASKEDGLKATKVLGQQTDLRRLNVGQKFTATFETFGDGRPPRLAGVAMTLPDGSVAIVGRNESDAWYDGPAVLATPEPAETAGETPPQPAEEDPAAATNNDTALDREAAANAAAPTVGTKARSPELPANRNKAVAPKPPETATKAPTDMPVVVSRTARPAPSGRTETRTIVLERGDGLFDRLIDAGATRQEAALAVKDLGKVINLRRLRIGETFRLTFSTPSDGGRTQLTGLSVNTTHKELVVLGWPMKDADKKAVATGPAIKRVEEQTATNETAPVEEVVAHDVLPLTHEFRVSKVARGDSLYRLLKRAGASKGEINLATRSLRRIFNPGRLQVGHQVIIEIEHTDHGARLLGLTLETGKQTAVKVRRDTGNQFTAHKMGSGAIERAIAVAEAQATARAEATKNGGLPKTVSVAATVDADDLKTRVNGYSVVNLADGIRTTVTLARGATLMDTMIAEGSKREEAYAAIQAVRELFDPRRLQAGQSVSLTFVNGTPTNALAPASDVPRHLAGLSLNLDAQTRLDVVRLEDGGFVSGFVERDLVRDYRRVDGEINSSLYLSADSAGVPRGVLMDLIRIYSFDVDFQRDVQRGDKFEILYEVYVDDQGTPVKPGDILYAELTVSGTAKPLYRYELSDGRVDYFNENGESSRKALMRTPIDGARMSSRFGMRKHPVLGYSKMHKGLDFAAQRGTPVYAAGDGVIERASRYGAYGNYVRIRHNSDYSTAYAHLKSFARGIYPGKKVRQGETIGYVGSTGRSTGPHLHYEVLYRQKHVNPLSVKIPTGVRLAEADRPGFDKERDRVAALFNELPSVRNVAENQGDASN